MNTAMDWELTSRLLVVTLYAAAFAVALYANLQSRSAARKWSTVAIMVISACWIVFYVWLLIRGSHVSSLAGMASRVCSYVTAVGLTLMAGQIWSSDKALRRVIREID